MSWSDGYISTLDMGTFSTLGRCPECTRLFWFDDAEELGWLPEQPVKSDWPGWRRFLARMGFDPRQEVAKTIAWKALPQEWQRALRVEAPDVHDLHRAVHEGWGTTPERASYLRTRLWWAGNHPARGHQGDDPLSDPEKRDNKQALLALVEALPPEKRNAMMVGELLRELGRFEEAVAVLRPWAEEGVAAARVLLEKAQAGDTLVCEIGRTQLSY